MSPQPQQDLLLTHSVRWHKLQAQDLLSQAPPSPSPESHLLLALLLQVHLHLQRLAGLQEGLAVLAVCHVVGHDAHDDGAQVEEDVGQDLDAKEEEEKIRTDDYISSGKRGQGGGAGRIH